MSTEGTETPQATEWTSGLSDDSKAYVQTKGFKDPSAVLESYRNLEKLVGVKEKLLQVPDDLSDAKSMDAVWNRLGRPEKPDGYGFKAPEGGNEKFVNWASENFHKLGLNTNQAKQLFEAYDSFAASEMKAADDAQLAANEKFKSELQTKWGAAFEQNVSIAKQAASEFGIDAETMTKMEQVVGPAKIIELMYSIGTKIGEGDYISGSSGSKKALTPAQASMRKSELMSDTEWVKRYLNGGAQENNELQSLLKLENGVL